jgi:broad specificity phosphatase PhoE
MLYITFIRHGQTTANVHGLIQGQSGGTLTPIGHQQAAALADRLAAEHKSIWSNVSQIYCSDLKRVQDTFSPVAPLFPNVPVCHEEILREKKAGKTWEGKSQQARRAFLHQRLANDPQMKRQFSSFADFERQFKEEDGESWLDVNVRASIFLCRVLRECCCYLVPSGSSSADKHILVFTHGGFIKETCNVIFKRNDYPNGAHHTGLFTLAAQIASGKLLPGEHVDDWANRVDDESLLKCIRWQWIRENDGSHADHLSD